MEQVQDLIDIPRSFFKESAYLLNRCSKPDRNEFMQISRAVGMGFLVMGFIGFFVKDEVIRNYPAVTVSRKSCSKHSSDPASKLSGAFIAAQHLEFGSVVGLSAYSIYLEQLIHIPINNIIVGGA